MKYKQTISPLSFSSPEEMLSSILQGNDMYNVETEEYVCRYHDKGASIIVYELTHNEAKQLEALCSLSEEFWDTHLSGGTIFMNKQPLDGSIQNPAIEWCKKTYQNPSWYKPIDTREAIAQNKKNTMTM